MLRSFELLRLLLSPEVPKPSDVWILCEDLDAFRFKKNDREASRLCFGESLGEGGYGGIAVRLGVRGGFGDSSGLIFDCCVTGRIVVPFVNGELGDDLGEWGVRELCPSELVAPGVSGDALFFPALSKAALKFRLGTIECLVGGILEETPAAGRVDVVGCDRNGR